VRVNVNLTLYKRFPSSLPVVIGKSIYLILMNMHLLHYIKQEIKIENYVPIVSTYYIYTVQLLSTIHIISS